MAESHRDEIAKLESLFAANPDGRIFAHLGEAYRKAGDLPRAREILERGLGRHGDYATAHVVLGRVLWDEGELDAAEDAFRRVLQLDAHNLVALRALGDLARSLGQTDVAVARYRELLQVDPASEGVEDLIQELAGGPDGAADVEGGPDRAGVREAGASEVATAAVEPADDLLMDLTVPGEAAVESGGDAGGDGLLDLPADMSVEGAAGAEEVPASPDEYGVVDMPGAAPAETADPGAYLDETTAAAGADESWTGGPSDEPPGGADPAAGFQGGAVEPDGIDADSWVPEWLDSEPEGAGAEGAVPREAEAADIAGTDAGDADWGDWPEDTEPWTPLEGETGAVAEYPSSDEGEHAAMVTETMGDLYAAQGLRERAAAVYRRLLEEKPDDERLAAKLAELEGGVATGAAAADETGGSGVQDDVRPLEEIEAAWTGGSGAAGAEDSPYTWRDQSEEAVDGGIGIGEYLRGLIAWTPGSSAAMGAAASAGATGADAETEAAPWEGDAAWAALEAGAEPEAGSAPEVASPRRDEAASLETGADEAVAAPEDPAPWEADAAALPESGAEAPSAEGVEAAEAVAPWEDDTAWAALEAGADNAVEEEFEAREGASAAEGFEAGAPTAAADAPAETASDPGEDVRGAGPPVAGPDDEAAEAAAVEAEGRDSGEVDGVADSELDAEIDRLFDEKVVRPEGDGEAETPPATGREGEELEVDDGDDDLEMFRAWLKSLKR